MVRFVRTHDAPVCIGLIFFEKTSKQATEPVFLWFVKCEEDKFNFTNAFILVAKVKIKGGGGTNENVGDFLKLDKISIKNEKE